MPEPLPQGGHYWEERYGSNNCNLSGKEPGPGALLVLVLGQVTEQVLQVRVFVDFF